MNKTLARVFDFLCFLFYYLLAFFVYVVSIPLLIYLSFKPKYKKSLPARFFLYNNSPFNEKLIWFHACSLGETRSLKPLIEKFEKINLSVITNTGFEAAKHYKKAQVRFLPFEIFLPFWIKPCKTLVVMEAELWYALFFVAKKKCLKTVLLNARISEKSFPKYMKFRWFYKNIFKHIDCVIAQSGDDAKRLKKLGAKNIEIAGNIKTYFDPVITREYIKQKPLIVLASTHENEEELILNNIINLIGKYQIAVVPRHPERFDSVYKKLQKFVRIKKLSQMKCESRCELNADVVLIDKMGELINLYKIADIVILGGSFVDNVGGHNPIEAAYFNVPIISGEYIFNQKALYGEVDGIQVCEINEIENKILKPKKTKIKNRVDIEKIISLIKADNV